MDVDNDDLLYARTNAESVWRDVVDSEAEVAIGTAIAVSPGGRPHIVYGQYDPPLLKHASKVAGIWQIEVIQEGLAGVDQDIVIDSAGRLHVAALNGSENLVYALCE